MNNSIFKDYGCKNSYKGKEKKKIIIILICISLLLISSFSFKSTMDTYINKGIKEDIWYRSIYVDVNEKIMSEEETIKNLEELKHVDNVILDNEFYITANINHEHFKGDFWLLGSNEKTRPKVSQGKNIENDNEVICPSRFYPEDNLEEITNLTNNDFIDMTKFIGTNIDISYNQYVDENLFEVNTISKKLTIVGTFDNNSYYSDENKCYVNNLLVQTINEESFKYIDIENQLSSIIVQVDNTDNVETVIEQIIDLELTASRVTYVNSKIISIVNIIIYIILAVSLIFSLIIINNIYMKDINNSLSKFNILRTVGFRKRDLVKLNIFENNFLALIITMILLIIIITIYVIYNILIFYRPYLFLKIPIVISIESIIFSILLIFVSLNLTTKKVNGKLTNSTIIEGLVKKDE